VEKNKNKKRKRNPKLRRNSIRDIQMFEGIDIGEIIVNGTMLFGLILFLGLGGLFVDKYSHKIMPYIKRKGK
jgi:hypothetical protein